MIDKYVLATNDDGDLAIRTVSATESSSVTDTTSVITATDDGKLAVRVVGGGGGGGDSHNKGSFLTPEALRTAYPTAEPGDFAIVESTDTVWVWDNDGSQWKDADTKGQVTSVNGQTGAVTVDTLPSQTGQSGKFLTTDGTDASWATVNALQNTATTTNSLGILGSVRGFGSNNTVVGSSSVAGSETKTYMGMTVIGAGSSANNNRAIAIGNQARCNGQGSIALGRCTISSNNTIGLNATEGAGLEVLNDANSMYVAIKSGVWTKLLSSDETIPTDRLPNAINKYSTMPTAASTNEGWIVQFTGTTDSTYTHGYIYECKAQGTDPETYAWEAVEVQAGSGGGLPSQTGNAGKFLTTDGTDASWSDKPLVNTFSDSTSVGILSYENRAYPRNVVIGSNTRYTAGSPSSGDSVWIGNSVNHPSLTSYWEATNSVIVGSKAAAQNNSVVIGYNARGGATNYAVNSVCVGYQAGTNGGDSQVAVGYSSVAGYQSVAIGRESNANSGSSYPGAYCIAIGALANAKASGAIQIGKGTNSTSGTLQIGLSTGGAYGTTNQYVLLDSDGTIPEARLADTTNATTGDVLTLDSNGNAVWQAGGSGGGSVPTLTWYSVSTAGDTLTIADTSSARLVKVYKNGLLLQPTDDYTISGTTLTTVAALAVGDKITTEVF